MKLLTALALLALTAPALAANRSHTSSVKQNTADQSWTQTCTIKVIGVSTLRAYRGELWIRYNDPDGEEELIRRRYVVTPDAPTFLETVTGMHSLSATLADNRIVVSISATRYGLLYPKYNGLTGALLGYGGTFTCSTNIIRGAEWTADTSTWVIVHNAMNEERIGSWQ